MIRDRGNIKWQGLMMPEHVVKINDWRAKERYEDRPELDDFDLEAIQEEIEAAHKRKCLIRVITWSNGNFTAHLGVITEINVQSMYIMLDDPFGTERILVNDIVGAQIRE